MRALRVTEPGTLEWAEVPAPTRPPGHALLKVRYAGICGSDIQTFKGTQPFASYPRIPGHEFSAEIVEIDPGTEGLQAGDLVTGVPYFQCGSCYACRRGIINACASNETMGVHRDGAFQEYITMPADRLYPARGVSPEDLAIVEPFSIGHHAMNRAGAGEGDKVLVIGAGAIGLLTMVSALVRGAEVWVADVVNARLEIARSLGASGTVNLAESTVQTAVDEATSGDGFDIVAEATGLPVSLLNSIEAAATGATIALIGNGTQEVTFNQSMLIKKELNVIGSRNSRGVFGELVELLASGRADVSRIRTRIVPAEDAPEALKAAAQGAGDDIKVLIEF